MRCEASAHGRRSAAPAHPPAHRTTFPPVRGSRSHIFACNLLASFSPIARTHARASRMASQASPRASPPPRGQPSPLEHSNSEGRKRLRQDVDSDYFSVYTRSSNMIEPGLTTRVDHLLLPLEGLLDEWRSGPSSRENVARLLGSRSLFVSVLQLVLPGVVLQSRRSRLCETVASSRRPGPSFWTCCNE